MAKLKRGEFCPMIKGDCKGLECLWYTLVRGTENNGGKEIEDYACAVAWIPVLLIENSNQQRCTAAAVESFRNEMVNANQSSQQLLLTASGLVQLAKKPEA